MDFQVYIYMDNHMCNLSYLIANFKKKLMKLESRALYSLVYKYRCSKIQISKDLIASRALYIFFGISSNINSTFTITTYLNSNY